MDHNPSPSTVDRKTIEKNRRNYMKALYSKLSSLVPRQSSKEVISLPDQLEEAINHIKKMQTSLEKLRQKKERLMAVESSNERPISETITGLKLPQIEIHEMGSALQVVLITGSRCQFIFTELIRILHEEGVEVINASFSVLDNAVFHTIHSKVAESAQESGAAGIAERLRKFVDASHYPDDM